MPECPTSQEVDDHPTKSSIILESKKHENDSTFYEIMSTNNIMVLSKELLIDQCKAALIVNH